MIRGYYKFLVLLFGLSTGAFAQYTKGRPYIDSLMNEHDSLKLFRELNYCSKLDYLDGLVNSQGKIVFYEDYFHIAIWDVCLYAKVDPKTELSDFAPSYRRTEDYYAVASQCRKKLECKKAPDKKWGSQINDSINRKTSDGKKEGFWVETKSGLRVEAYYKNDSLDGPFKSYYQNGVLGCFGFYQNGEHVGPWYYFDEKGRLIFVQSETKKVNFKRYDVVVYRYSSYIKSYDINNNLIDEGRGYHNDVEENILKVGQWKFYKNGKYVSSKDYKLPK